MTSPRLRDSLDDLDALLGQAADALNRPYAFLEKDFWAMEVLRVAARDRPIALRDGTTGTVRTVFKGGTSLSRVYGLIDRFSEDIDLLVILPDEGGGASETQRDKLLKGIQAEVHQHLDTDVVRQELLRSTRGVKRDIKYHYPLREATHTALTEGVTLEMGSRGGAEPAERHALRSIVADYAMAELGEPADQWEEFAAFDVNVLGAERTLLEKLAAVHTITSDATAVAPAGWGRHLHDVYWLLESEAVREKLAALGPDGRDHLVDDIERRSAAAGWPSAPRPAEGYASSPAFDSGAPTAATVAEAYEAVKGLMYGPVVPIDDCRRSVRQWSEYL
ncbi:nucleotidyl transferase AbiEii/AbiGii toxin family protein [Mycobacteroides abscessus]|uniref:nucleotidyl transferase AbiEii/AbiGii toxin family protein n=1 Tax=Mycobacteroides abscessus TaxID=36809 RepID=UPI00094169A3|nr:nucleotidyl transferase AbiEii/AbiGii toxin family protein [Mycobacteroides abscessus]